MANDIQRNPRPPIAVIQVSYSQGHSKYGDTAGKQCAAVSLFTLSFSQSLQPEFWTTNIIDYIVDQGTKLYKSLNILRYLEAHELPTLVTVNKTSYHIELCYCEQGILNCERSINFTNCLRDGFNRSSCLLLWVGPVTLSLMKNSTDFFLFDSHSRDENGHVANEGTSVLLRFLDYHDISDYITSTYLANVGSTELIFEIQCATISEVGDPFQTSFGFSNNVVASQSSVLSLSCQSEQVHLDRFTYHQKPSVIVPSPNSCHHLPPDKAAKRTMRYYRAVFNFKERKVFHTGIQLFSFSKIFQPNKALSICSTSNLYFNIQTSFKMDLKTLEEILESWSTTIFSDS